MHSKKNVEREVNLLLVHDNEEYALELVKEFLEDIKKGINEQLELPGEGMRCDHSFVEALKIIVEDYEYIREKLENIKDEICY